MHKNVDYSDAYNLNNCEKLKYPTFGIGQANHGIGYSMNGHHSVL